MGDMLYNFTEWLRSTQLTELSLWIADTGLSNLIVTNFWAIPIIQVFHILSLAAAFGAVFMITLRVFVTSAGSGGRCWSCSFRGCC